MTAWRRFVIDVTERKRGASDDDTAPLIAAANHITVPQSQIRSVMGPCLTEIMTAVKAQGIGPIGPWFTHYLKMDAATFDFDICVPVSAAVKSVGRVENRMIPSTRVVQTVLPGRLRATWSGMGGVQ
jgi:hypothetical protein